jgi:hypothetical protein
MGPLCVAGNAVLFNVQRAGRFTGHITRLQLASCAWATLIDTSPQTLLESCGTLLCLALGYSHEILPCVALCRCTQCQQPGSGSSADQADAAGSGDTEAAAAAAGGRCRERGTQCTRGADISCGEGPGDAWTPSRTHNPWKATGERSINRLKEGHALLQSAHACTHCMYACRPMHS